MSVFVVKGKEIINTETGEIVQDRPHFLIVQFARNGLAVFYGNKTRTTLRFTKDVEDAVWFYNEDHAIAESKKFRYGRFKVVTLMEALALEKEGIPEGVNFNTFKGMSMKEDYG